MVRHAYSNPKEKRGRYVVEPIVFAVPNSETISGYHEVLWAKDGNLNMAVKRGNIKRFRLWTKAKYFAKSKGEKMGVKPIIHRY